MIATTLSHGSISREIRRNSAISRPGRSLRLHVNQKFILRPIGVMLEMHADFESGWHLGDNKTDHIGGVQAPVVSEVKLNSGVYEVGREKPADVVIPVPTVSARHALIRISETEVTVTDLESTNGTFINKVELNPMRSEKLELGSEVIFGDEHLAMFQLVDEPTVDLVEAEAEVLP